MPLHDWTRVSAGTFHDFHQAWIIELRNILNGGLLPESFYAQAEQSAGGVRPDILTLQERDDGESASWTPQETSEPGGAAVAVAEHPPDVALTEEAEERVYARTQDHLTIRHLSDDRLIALVEVISIGNKRSRLEIDRLFGKMDAALEQGVHLLILDLHPPGPNDPRGLHAAFWESAFGESEHELESPRGTLAAYRADPVVIATAYVQPIEVGHTLPPMALFLTPGWYVNVPLEETYLRGYAGVPRQYRRVLES